jgi:hypothetical protein
VGSVPTRNVLDERRVAAVMLVQNGVDRLHPLRRVSPQDMAQYFRSFLAVRTNFVDGRSNQRFQRAAPTRGVPVGVARLGEARQPLPTEMRVVDEHLHDEGSHRRITLNDVRHTGQEHRADGILPAGARHRRRR